MSITVNDAIKLNQLKPLVMVSGQKGLNRIIEKIGILDYELIEGIHNDFGLGDFVLTTFTPIRHDMVKVEQAIKDLIHCNVSALAIKSIYIKTLPEAIIDYANRKNFPIFMFDESVFFEDVIEDLMEGMHTRSYMELMASKIEILFNNDFKKPVIKALAYELNSNFLSDHIAFYFKEKKYLNDELLISIAERYQRNRSRSIHHSMFKYKEGLLLILSYKKMSDVNIQVDLNHIFNTVNIKQKTFYSGQSTTINDLSALDQSIKESIYAARASEILKEDQMNYKNIGIYKLLLPYSQGKWLTSFASGILDPLKSYDQGKLMDTARNYILCGGDISKTAQLMFQHKNTIRYRINKMQSLLNSQNPNEFYEQLSIAIKCEAIL